MEIVIKNARDYEYGLKNLLESDSLSGRFQVVSPLLSLPAAQTFLWKDISAIEKISSNVYVE